MLLSGVGTIIVGILEGLGVFDDLGLVLSVVGIVLSIMFGVTASTRTTMRSIGAGVAGLRVEIGGVGSELVGVRLEVGGLRADTGAVREEIRATHGQVGAVRAEIGTLREPLERILSVLIERLPPAPIR
jgi:hypothetical protein